MKAQDIVDILNETFLIQMVEVLDFNFGKNSGQMKVLCVEEKGTVERNYMLEFNDVLMFEYCNQPWVLRNDELEMDVDDKRIINLKDLRSYPLEKPENAEEYWALLMECEAFNLNIVFKSVIRKALD